MLDSGAIGLADAERYLSAVGPMDAVGYHPYLYDVTRMEQDTLALRQWLDANGHGGVPLDINEFGAAGGVTAGSAAWGAQVAQYTQWALCTPSLLVENVQAFWWGAVPLANTSPWFAMVDSALSQTPLGTAYLGEVSALTTQGCPAVAPAPSTTTHAVVPTSKRAKPHKTPEAGEALPPPETAAAGQGLPRGTWQHLPAPEAAASADFRSPGRPAASRRGHR